MKTKLKNQTDRADRADWTDLPPAAVMSNADLLRYAPQIVAAGIRRGLLSHGANPEGLTECLKKPATPEEDRALRERDAEVCAKWEPTRPQLKDYPQTAVGKKWFRDAHIAWNRRRLKARREAAGGYEVPDLRLYEEREVAL